MSGSGRAAVVGALALAGVLAAAGPAPAQFGGGFGYGTRPFLPGLSITPPPITYGQQYQLTAVTPLGGAVTLRREFYGPVGLWMSRRYAPVYIAPGAYRPMYAPISGSYMTGGVKNAAVDNAQRDLAKAQAQGAMRPAQPAARAAIADLWAYERPDAGNRPPGEVPPAVAAAMNAGPETVTTGEALNQAAALILAAEPKAPKVEAAYVSPLILDKVRFGGSPAADAANLLRQAGRVQYPAVFENGPLADLRPTLDREFAAAAAPALAGKPTDPAKVAALEATAAKARAALEPAIPDLGFEEAIAARRFLNQLDATAKTLRTPAAAGLVDPRWAAEGVSVADLNRHMAKQKLQFAPAPKGDDDAYLALYRGMVGYLVGLTERQPAKK